MIMPHMGGDRPKMVPYTIMKMYHIAMLPQMAKWCSHVHDLRGGATHVGMGWLAAGT